MSACVCVCVRVLVLVAVVVAVSMSVKVVRVHACDRVDRSLHTRESECASVRNGVRNILCPGRASGTS